MRDFRDAKAMAQTLRDVLAVRSFPLTHSESLELVAKMLGFRDWNVLSAKIQSHAQPSGAMHAASVSGEASLPLAPMRDAVFFPGMIAPIFIGRDKTKRAVEYALASNVPILSVTQRHSGDDAPTADALYPVGVTADIIDLALLGDGSFRAIVKCVQRVAIEQFAEGEFLSAVAMPVAQTRALEAEAFALAQNLLSKVQSYLNIDPATPQAHYGRYARLPHIREPGLLADAVAPLLRIDIDRRQDLLETSDVIARLEKISAIVEADRQAA